MSIRDEMSEREFQRRGARAFRRMTRRQQSLFISVRMDQTPYTELALRYGISARAVEDDMRQAIEILCATMTEREIWWQRLLPW